MIKRLSIYAFLFVLAMVGCKYGTVSAKTANLTISNEYFSFTMPSDTKGTYKADKMDNGIYICEKISEKTGEGGFAFGFRIYENPDEYVDSPDNKKIGELVDKNGTVYDMVLIHPMEIRYGNSKTIEKNYTRLYDCAESIETKGVNGNIYYKNRGMKGEDLYPEILKKYQKAISEKWDSKKLTQENMNTIYSTLTKKDKNALNKIGYIYYDLNSDGLDELIIGEINAGNTKNIVYDIYTMVDRKPKHVISGNTKNKYFICEDGFLCNNYTTKDKKNAENFLILNRNSIKLHPTVKFLNYGNNRLIGYGLNGDWENVSKEEFNERKKLFDRFYKLDLIPLSKLK